MVKAPLRKVERRDTPETEDIIRKSFVAEEDMVGMEGEER